MVQTKTFSPTGMSAMVVVGLAASVIVPPPLNTLHAPVPGNVALFPAIVAVVFGVHSSWSGPAAAGAAVLSNTAMVTVSTVGGP